MAIDPNKTYTIKGSLLVTLLATAGISGAGVTALFTTGDLANAAEGETPVRVSVDLSPAGKSAAVSLVNGELCPEIDSQIGLSPGTCTAAKVLQYSTGNIDMRAVDRSDPPDGTKETVVMGVHLRLPDSRTVSMP